MDNQPTIESERLVLKAFEFSDAKFVQDFAGDRRVADTTENIPHPYPDGLAESWISSRKEKWEKGIGLTYAVTSKKNLSLLGAVGLEPIRNTEAGLGYWIGVPYWNYGFCMEAVQLLIELSFSDLKIQRIYAKHLTRNPASGRVLLKTGFSHIGCTQEERWKHEGLVEIEQYEIFNI